MTIPLLVWMFAFGLAASRSAARLGRARLAWFGFGAILGPIALVLLQLAPPALCRTCGSQTRGWLKVCWWCRQSVFGIDDSIGTLARAPQLRQAAGDAATDQPQPDQETAAPEPASPPSPAGASANISIRARRRPRSSAPITPLPDTTPSLQVPVIVGEDEARHLGPRTVEPTISSAVPRAGTAAPAPTASREVIATAVYVTGTANLQAGHRYGIALRGARFQILGPTELSPDRIAVDRPAAGLEARAVEGRLIVADPGGLVLAFMGVAGPPTSDLAAAISSAASRSGQA